MSIDANIRQTELKQAGIWLVQLIVFIVECLTRLV